MDWFDKASAALPRMPYLNFLAASYVIATTLIPLCPQVDEYGARLAADGLAIVRATVQAGDFEAFRADAYRQAVTMRRYLSANLPGDVEGPVMGVEALVAELAGVSPLYASASVLPAVADSADHPALASICDQLQTVWEHAKTQDPQDIDHLFALVTG